MSSSTPSLRVIAGCNGSGKSTYSSLLTGRLLVPFDYDKVFLEKYGSLFDSELRDHMAHNLAFDTLQNAVDNALTNRLDFAYETNFNADPMFWPNKFRAAGYELELCFFCLESVQEAKRRVQFRFQNGGHFVPDSEVEDRFLSGYQHLDDLFKQFDSVHLFDTNAIGQAPQFVASITLDGIATARFYPAFLQNKLPKLSAFVQAY